MTTWFLQVFLVMPAGASFLHRNPILPWDGNQVLGRDADHQCDWKVMAKGQFLGGGAPPEICLRTYKDLLSDHVRAAGYFADCPALASWWADLTKVPHDTAPMFVDVGTNLGACLLPMVARPDVPRALAFEPNPENLFYLTNSLLRNKALNSKVKLYPFALGNTTKTQDIYVEDDNPGNTVVGRPAGEADPQSSGQVQIKRLDDVIAQVEAQPYIPLMKLDAQGYEVKIIQGAKQLFSSGAVRAVKFELATEWLIKQGSSAAEYFNTFIRYGYQIYNTESKVRLQYSDLVYWACGPSVIHDFVAMRLETGEHAWQKPITQC